MKYFLVLKYTVYKENSAQQYNLDFLVDILMNVFEVCQLFNLKISL